MRAAAIIPAFLVACAVRAPPPPVPAPPPRAAAPTPDPAPEAAGPSEVAAPVEPPRPPEPGAPSTALRLHRGTDLASIAPLTEGGSGTQLHVPGPAVVLGGVLAPPELTDAAQVVAGLRKAFMRCYNRALSEDPNMVGVVALGLAVAPSGEVTSVGVNEAKGVSPSLVRCLAAAARHAQFAQHPGGTATLSVPITMVRQ